MLAGKLPTPSLDADDRPAPARRDDGSDRRPPTTDEPTSERLDRLEAENERLERRLAAERDRRRQVVQRYERLLAARDATGVANGRRDDSGHERGVAAALRDLRWRLWRVRRRLDPRRSTN